MDSRRGDFWCVLSEESLEGRAKDCSKGLGSRSKVERLGRGGGRWGRSSWREVGDGESVEEGCEAGTAMAVMVE